MSETIANGVSREIARGDIETALNLIERGAMSSPQLERLGSIAATRAGQEELRMPPPSLTPEELATRILDSLVVENGMQRLDIPPQVTGREAIRALNTYFRKTMPRFNRDVIFQDGVDLARHFDRTDVSESWALCLHGVVPGTTELGRADQGRVLSSRGLAFANPLGLALVAGAYACLNDGKSLTEGLNVRCDSERVVIKPHPLYGLMMCSYPDDMPFASVGAAGTYLR